MMQTVQLTGVPLFVMLLAVFAPGFVILGALALATVSGFQLARESIFRR